MQYLAEAPDTKARQDMENKDTPATDLVRAKEDKITRPDQTPAK